MRLHHFIVCVLRSLVRQVAPQVSNTVIRRDATPLLSTPVCTPAPFIPNYAPLHIPHSCAF
jgi:hypothetical protein